jgi:hypothetical protein
VPVEGGTEAVDEAHRPKLRVWHEGGAGLAKMRLDHAQKDVQHGAEGPRLALQVPAQSRL